MESRATTPEPIEKEAIADLKFTADEILKDAEAIKARTIELERALKLGNLEKFKINIVFEDQHGVKQVNTTIWGVTDKRVILKQGVVIPINRIHEVKI